MTCGTTPKRVMLVGEDNPRSLDPRHALYPMPKGCAGDRLRNHLGLTVHEYLRAFDRVNLCQGPWDKQAAASAALHLLTTHRGVLVLLGSKVRDAFSGPAPLEAKRVYVDLVLVGLPHPSGRCRAWNDQTTRAAALKLLRQHAPEIPFRDEPAGTE